MGKAKRKPENISPDHRCCRLTADPASRTPRLTAGRQLSTRYRYMHVWQIQIQLHPTEASRRSEFVKYVTNIFNLVAIFATLPPTRSLSASSSFALSFLCSTIYNSIVLISFRLVGCKKWSSIELTVLKVKCSATIYQLVHFHPFRFFVACFLSKLIYAQCLFGGIFSHFSSSNWEKLLLSGWPHFAVLAFINLS